MALEENDPHDGKPLILPVMQTGRRINADTALNQIRQWTLAGYARLPKEMTTLEVAPTYPVVISAPLQALAKQLDEMHT